MVFMTWIRVIDNHKFNSLILAFLIINADTNHDSKYLTYKNIYQSFFGLY